MTPPRSKPDGSRTVQVRILPIQEEPGPFADLPDWTPAIRTLVFGGRTANPAEQNQQDQTSNHEDQ